MKIKIIIFNLLTLIIFKSLAYGENFLLNAANYTVKIKAKSQYPFAETEGAGSWMGAGFLINKERILFNKCPCFWKRRYKTQVKI